MKIFILKPSSLGDVVQALPVLRLLKRWRADAQVYWWLETDLLPLLEGDPDLAGLIPFDRRRWASPRNWNSLWASLKGMRGQKFDWVIDLQSLARSGAFAWLANGGLLAGLDDAREGARGFYDIVVPRATYHTHAVDWYLDVLRALRVPVNQPFVWLPERPALALAARTKWLTDDARWVALVPGARWVNKRWPAAHFAALARQLTGECADLRVVILGNRADREMGQVISASASGRCLDLTGQTSLPETIECLRRCAVVVSNDTGPMHIAAALRRPLIALFGPTEPRRTGPYGQLGNVLQTALDCVPCMSGECAHERPLECLKVIRPDTVAERVQVLLQAPPSADSEWRLE